MILCQGFTDLSLEFVKGVFCPQYSLLYIDKIVYKLLQSGLGCYVKGFFSGMWLYADDVVLLSASVSQLHTIYDQTMCE